MSSQFNCLRYWDLSSQIRLDDAVALWCNADPAELGRLGFNPECMSAKRAALVTALRDGRLEYEDLGIVMSQGQVFRGAPLDELLAKDRLLIHKDSLRRWFEQLPFEDRPAFLFDEERQVPLPDGSDVAEMNSLKAIAIMGHLMALSSGKYRLGERPNAGAIGTAVAEAAREFFGSDVRGFASFNKKLGAALTTFNQELPERFR
jgi:hypothetical protein